MSADEGSQELDARTEEPEPAEKAPRVFISYSHDTPQHKKWVGEFACKLVDHHVDVNLDQWDIGPGDDLPKYMEKSVSGSDFVLLICTEPYVRKVDDGKGGAGYEAMIVTGELVKDLGTAKFIPVIRQEGGGETLPKCVSTRFWVNFSEGKDEKEQFEVLIRKLHNAPKLKKPPLGKNPFAVEAAASPAVGLAAVATPSMVEPVGPAKAAPAESPLAATIESEQAPLDSTAQKKPEQVLEHARQLAQRGDLIEWRRFVKSLRPSVNQRLLEWEKGKTNWQGLKTADLPGMVLEAAGICAPLYALALAGVESGKEQFANQTALIDDLLKPKDWIRSGLTVVVDMPTAMLFVYQAIHGALCMDTQQLPLALQLAASRVHLGNRPGPTRLSEETDLMGWPESLGSNCVVAWRFISMLPEKWPWLLDLFGTLEDYHAALSAYYLALNIQELARAIAQNNTEKLGATNGHLTIPLLNLQLSSDVNRAAYRLLIQVPAHTRDIWRKQGVSDTLMAQHWPNWIAQCKGWITDSSLGFYRFHGSSLVVHEPLFEDLRPEK